MRIYEWFDEISQVSEILVNGAVFFLYEDNVIPFIWFMPIKMMKRNTKYICLKDAFLFTSIKKNGAGTGGSVRSVAALAAWRPAPVVGPSAAAVSEAAVVAAAAAPPGIASAASGGFV